MIAFKKLRPLMNRVIIRKAAPLSKTKGGILLPEKQDQMNFGVVISCGPGRYNENGVLRPCTVKEGDTVLLPEYGGTKIVLAEDKEYYVYRDDDIVGTLHDPTH